MVERELDELNELEEYNVRLSVALCFRLTTLCHMKREVKRLSVQSPLAVLQPPATSTNLSSSPPVPNRSLLKKPTSALVRMCALSLCLCGLSV